MSAPEVRIALHEVSHAYRQGARRVQVLEGVTERFHAGEFAVLLGRSGSGKTTLLNLLGALEVPERGEIEMLGHRLSSADEASRAAFRRQHVGMVFQSYNLVPTLCAWENVALPLTLLGIPLAEAYPRALEELTRVALAELADRMPDQLSGGEQQRVAIARAIVHRPPILLADEPTGNLDLETALDVVARLVEVVRAHGITLLMATHSLEVAGHADRVLRLQGGRLVAAPPP
ncbi:MAG: ABC transporter ATP-binding protein [Gammaproteobacteria bacterium]|nr:MAG: ABC transporter ATP-binding protein [Gammaproteobacteria bacterium]